MKSRGPTRVGTSSLQPKCQKREALCYHGISVDNANSPQPRSHPHFSVLGLSVVLALISFCANESTNRIVAKVLEENYIVIDAPGLETVVQGAHHNIKNMTKQQTESLNVHRVASLCPCCVCLALDPLNHN